MLKLYRRHLRACRFWSGNTDGNRTNNNCRCPIWVDGMLQGERINKTLALRDWTRASEKIRDWEIARAPVAEEKPAGVPVRDAVDVFMADLESQGLSTASIKKYKVLLANTRPPEKLDVHSPSLLEFCKANSIQFTNQIELLSLVRFRGEWKDAPLSGSKKLERLRCFGRFMEDHKYWPENLAKKLKPPKVDDPPTMPFTRDEVTALLGACEKFTDWRGEEGQENAHRLRAFILFLRYSALRISDAASCPVDRLQGNKLFLYTQKTGVPVYTPLPSFVIAALDACPRKSDRYWFWTGVGSKETLAGNWRRTFRRLCELAGVPGGHPHQFRDTLAVELLLDGVKIERVSALLGHKSIKITQKHYNPWVQARQAQLEADLVGAWRNDPIAQMEILRAESKQDQIGTGLESATPLRHGSGVVPN
jgi:integrase